MQKPTDQMCGNGCQFAKKVMLQAYTSRGANGSFDGAEYMWRCMKIDQLVTIDTILHKVGCATFTTVKQQEMAEQAEALISEVDQKINEIAKENPAVAAAITSSGSDQVDNPEHRMTAVGGEYSGESPVTETQKNDAEKTAEYLKTVTAEPTVHVEIPVHPVDGVPLMATVQIKEVVTDGFPVHQMEVKEPPKEAAPPAEPKRRGRKPREHPVETTPATEPVGQAPSATETQPVQPLVPPVVEEKPKE